MPTDPRLENYLATLDRVLGPIPVSDRADIVMEIKSHVLAALDRDPQASLDSVLEALGPAEVVANRYLIERGLKPSKPPVSPVVKWLVIGFLGTAALVITAIVVLTMHFSPLIRVNEDEERVTLLGGLVEVQGEGNLRFGAAGKFTGESEVAFAPGESVAVAFSNGKIGISTAKGERLEWRCKGLGSNEPAMEDRNGVKTLNLEDFLGVKCNLKVPKDVKFQLQGNNGKVSLKRPRFSVEAALVNGKVNVTPAEGERYTYEFQVKTGLADHPPSDTNPKYSLKIAVGNGKISKSGHTTREKEED